MAVSTAAQLTQQFYAWEGRGRGWHKADFACDLEPPFAPFFGHYLPESPIIDDGRRTSWFQSLFSNSAPIQHPTDEAEEAKAFPYTNSTAVTIFVLVIPKHAVAHSEDMEQLIVMLSYRAAPISFEIIGTATTMQFQIVCRDTDAVYVRTQLAAFFPGYGVLETTDDRVEDMLRSESCIYTIDFGLEEECMRPLAQLAGKESYTSLFGVCANLRHDECVIVQVLFCGVQNPWAQHMQRAVHDNDGKGAFFFDDPDMVKYTHEKTARPLLATAVRMAAFSDTIDTSYDLINRSAIALRHGAKSSSNGLILLNDETYTVYERLGDMLLRQSHRVGMLLNSRELCNLAHLPLIPLRNTTARRTTKAAPSAVVGHDYLVGINEHHGAETVISLSTEQRLRHTHIIGATGTGKSTLLHALMMQDVELGNGFLCLDPHGDLIDMLLDTIPQERMNDVVLIDPSDSAHPIGFNILRAHSEQEKELLASDLVALFRRFSTSWGDQMNSVFANAISAFLYNTKPGTLADLRRFLIETSFRNAILTTVTDPDITYYWQHEYPILKSSSIGSILTRLDTFLRPKVIRNMVCQQTSVDFAHLMDSQKIILVKLSQGLLGAENSYLLGAFIVSKLQQIAMSRQAQAKETRVPFYCYIDEFHHFTTPSMNEILSGTRKYGLGLVLAHQNMAQVQHDSDIASTLLGNAGTRICMRVNDTDAKRLQEGFASFTADDLQNLAIGEAIIRVGTADTDCSITVVPYYSEQESVAENIIAYSRATYGSPVETIAYTQSPPAQPPPERQAPTQREPIPEEQIQQPPPQREHIYLQTFIKTMAEQAGYKTQLEIKTPDGNGQVDVLVEKDGIRTAIEISVTTSAEWELHNVQKCIAAGYENIVVCTADVAKMQRLKTLIAASLSANEQLRVTFLTPDTIQSLFTPIPESSATPTMMKGYRVKVQYGTAKDTGDVIRQMLTSRTE